MKKSEENNSPKHLHIAKVHIQGYYQIEAAKINSQAAIKSAQIGAHARYFQGTATLIGALGVFGGFAYKLYESNKKIHEQTEKLKDEIEKQDNILQELAQSYEKLAELYSNAGRNTDAQESHEKSEKITHQRSR
ncbi:MAG: hypothetical protein Tsb005_14090 [Gammaproteobacteria bacterium]